MSDQNAIVKDALPIGTPLRLASGHVPIVIASANPTLNASPRTAYTVLLDASVPSTNIVTKYWQITDVDPSNGQPTIEPVNVILSNTQTTQQGNFIVYTVNVPLDALVNSGSQIIITVTAPIPEIAGGLYVGYLTNEVQ